MACMQRQQPILSTMLTRQIGYDAVQSSKEIAGFVPPNIVPMANVLPVMTPSECRQYSTLTHAHAPPLCWNTHTAPILICVLDLRETSPYIAVGCAVQSPMVAVSQ